MSTTRYVTLTLIAGTIRLERTHISIAGDSRRRAISTPDVTLTSDLISRVGNLDQRRVFNPVRNQIPGKKIDSVKHHDLRYKSLSENELTRNFRKKFQPI